MKSNKIRFISLIIWIISLQLIGSTIGIVFKPITDLWYINLVKSPYSPPGYIFPIAWTTLYLLIAIAGWLIWDKEADQSTKKLFILQMICNWIWTPLFFYLHFTFISLICIGVIILSTSIIITKQIKETLLISILLTPYLLWSLFAFYLNGFIYTFN